MFQRYVIKIFMEKFDILIVMYMDNMLIYNKDLDQSHVKVIT